MPLISAAIPIQQPRMRFFDAEGKPLVGGKVYSYKVGTDLFRPTFRDANKTALNQNPIVLDDAGSALIYLSGSHLIKVFDKFDNFIEMRYLPVTEMRTYFFDKLGNPLKYGKIETYDIHSTIKKPSYQNSEKTILNPNPVILDENGSAIICIVGSYRLRVYDGENVFLWDEDFLREIAFTLTSKIYPLYFDEIAFTGLSVLDSKFRTILNEAEHLECALTALSFQSAKYISLLNIITNVDTVIDDAVGRFNLDCAKTMCSISSAKVIDPLNVVTLIEDVKHSSSISSARYVNALITNTAEVENISTSIAISSSKILK